MKESLREKYKIIRKNIIDKTNKDNQIYEKVISNNKVINSKKILIYVSLNDEVDTLKLIKYFLTNKEVAVPKIENGIMNFYYINSLTDLKKGLYNILEPQTKRIVTDFTNSIIITPGICFDIFNYRIGYGKGYYDKFFKKHNNTYKIGLCYDECLIDNTYNDSYDIPVDEVITPTKTLVKSHD